MQTYGTFQIPSSVKLINTRALIFKLEVKLFILKMGGDNQLNGGTDYLILDLLTVTLMRSRESSREGRMCLSRTIN